MQDLFKSEKLNDGSWAFATILKITSESVHITNERLSMLLNEFGEKGNSFEIMFESTENNRIQCFLILRDNSFNLEELNVTFPRLINNLVDRLKYEKFNVDIINSQESEAFIHRMSRRKKLYLGVPGIVTKKFPLCYIPGGYRYVTPLDFSYILSVLKQGSNSGISFQMSSTYFLDEEKKSIIENVNWLNKKFDSNPRSMEAMNIYQSFFAMAKEKMFFLCVSFWGEENELEKLFHNFKTKGYGMYRVSQEVYYSYDYLIVGTRILSNFAAAIGYKIPMPHPLPQGQGRLEYLVTANVVGRIIDINKAIEDDEWQKHEKIDNADLPAVFFEASNLELGNQNGTENKIYMPWEQLVKHMTIAGMSGCGKTTVLFKILIELNKNKIPFLIIEPTKTEHRELMDVITDLKIYTPGKTKVSPIMFNPFLPPKHVTLEQFLPSLISAFQMAFSMPQPLDVMFAEVVHNCYARYGWRNDSTRESYGVKPFGLHEFICAFKEEVANSSYDVESKQNLNGGGVYRLQSLLNDNQYLFDTDQTLDFEELLTGHTLIELDAIDNQEQKALLMSLILLQIKLVIRNTQKKDSQLKNVILIDEAHVLLDTSYGVVQSQNKVSASAKMEEYLLDMVKVNRVFGTGMIFADQSISILRNFANNANIKLIMHLESYEERIFLKQNLNLSDAVVDKIAELGVGQFYVACEKLKNPLLIQLEDVRKEHPVAEDISDEELEARISKQYEKPYHSCQCKNVCDLSIRNEADYIAKNVCSKFVKYVTIGEEIETEVQDAINDMICQMAEDSDNEKRLIRCAKMMTNRMLYQKANMNLHAMEPILSMQKKDDKEEKNSRHIL